MRSYDSTYGYDGTGAKEEMIAKVQDVKASPYAGKKRLVVKAEGANRSHAVIDIDMKHAKDIVRSTARQPRHDEDERRSTRSERDLERERNRPPKKDTSGAVKGKYIFQVEERDDSRNPGFQRKKSAEFKAYDCHEKPEQYTAGTDTERRMNRFGGGSGSGKGSSGRTKF